MIFSNIMSRIFCANFLMHSTFLVISLEKRMSKIAILVKDKLPGKEWRQTLFIVNQMA